ncbi:hypothetical protein [Pseudoalteromonas byunsanensis]|uniref:Uncharacterized protein n=1 Tax=Pseudoalteromonas byunsanensis TaxID=327939 RepID=A0A1S1N5W8_9GAMM|nr:hypothetical protein [Pseudoalteromonas byunsanensis]OHU94039.1 hypothetical protein BIW53_17620 [Pseudoalteromonas byunsanensis]
MQNRTLLVGVLAVLLNGCGGSSSTETPPKTDANTQLGAESNKETGYTLNVESNFLAKGVAISWMGTTLTLASSEAVTLTKKATKFEEPALNNTPNNMTCNGKLSTTNDTAYRYAINCELNEGYIAFTQTTELMYPITVKYGQETFTLSSNIHTVKQAQASNYEIVSFGGPQDCEASEAQGVVGFNCARYTLAYSHRKLYKVYNKDHKALIFDAENYHGGMFRISPYYLWFNDAIWLINAEEPAGNVYSLSVTNHSNIQKHDVHANSLLVNGDALYALSYSQNQIHKLANGAWKSVNFYKGERETDIEQIIVSDIVHNNENAYIVTADKHDPQQLSYVTFEDGNIHAKPLGSAIVSPASTPLFKFDNNNYAIGFNIDNQLVVNNLDGLLEERNEAITTIADVTNATLWQHNENQYLFVNNSDGVQQFTTEGSSNAFDTTELNNLSPDWIGGDLKLLIAGKRHEQTLKVNEEENRVVEFATLEYLRQGDKVQNEAQLKKRLNTQSPIYINYNNSLLELKYEQRQPAKQITPLHAYQGFLLVYVGENESIQSSGQLWLLSTDEAHLVTDNFAWEIFADGDIFIEQIDPLLAIIYNNYARQRIYTVELDKYL